jgi:cytochrome b6-f complex iron-sulfur subunit
MAKEKKLSADEQAALEAIQQKREAGAPAAPPQIGSLWSRRDFMGRLSWGGFTVFTGVSLLAFVRSAFPRVLFTPPSTFKAGVPSDYTIGEVSEKYKQEHRVWIIREPDGFYALFAKCTHLGCTPRWLKVEEKFKCPCHGSGFRPTGINFEGPAPRPLERNRIVLAEDGQILIDKSRKFQYELGQWIDPDAFLRI